MAHKTPNDILAELIDEWSTARSLDRVVNRLVRDIELAVLFGLMLFVYGETQNTMAFGVAASLGLMLLALAARDMHWSLTKEKRAPIDSIIAVLSAAARAIWLIAAWSIAIDLRIVG